MSDEPLFVWQVFDDDNRWGIVSCVLPQISTAPIPLITRSIDVAIDTLGFYAGLHAKATGKPVRLARYELTEVTPTS